MMEMRGVLHQLTEQQLLQIWRDNPFSQLDASEVLENCRIGSKAKQRNLEKFYVKQFRPVLPTLSSEQTTLWFIEGPSGSGKSSAAQAIRRLLIRDEYLNKELEVAGKKLHLQTLIYGEALVAGQLELFTPQGDVARQINTPERNLRRLVSDQAMGTFPRQEYAEVSQFAWTQLERHVLANNDPSLAKVVIIEANIDSGLPIINNGRVIKVNGHDRGTRILANAAFDERTRETLFVSAFSRDEKVMAEAVRTRTEAQSHQLSLEAIQSGEEVIVIQLDNDELVNIIDLPEWFQIRVIEFKNKISNSPRGIQIADAQIKQNWQRTNERYKKDSKFRKINTAKRWHRFLLQDLLQIPASRWKTTYNELMLGTPRTFDFGYLIQDSLIVKHFPEIWDPIPSSYSQILGLSEGVS